MRYHDKFVKNSIKHFGVNLFTDAMVAALKGLELPSITFSPGLEGEQLHALDLVADSLVSNIVWENTGNGRHDFYQEAYLSQYICHQLFPEFYELKTGGNAVVTVDAVSVDARERLHTRIDEMVGGSDLIMCIRNLNPGDHTMDHACIDFQTEIAKIDSIMDHFNGCEYTTGQAQRSYEKWYKDRDGYFDRVKETIVRQNIYSWSENLFHKYVRALWIDFTLTTNSK